MDPSLLSSRDGWDPRIDDIIDRARQLTVDEIYRLAGAYRRADRGSPGPFAGARDRALNRTRTIGIARDRSGRAVDARRLETLAVAAVRDAASRSGAMRVLARLGTLWDAELAVADAALSVLLADRLSEEIANELARPWQDPR